MKHFFTLLILCGGANAAPLAAQDLTNSSAAITIQPGATLYVGAGGLTNQAGASLTNDGILRLDGPLANAGTINLSIGAMEVRADLTNTGTLLPGTSPVTFSGLADQQLSPGGATLYQLLLNKPTAGANTLRLAGDLTVSNLLSLSNGLINTKTGAVVNKLRLPNGATLSNEGPGRYVLGKLEITRAAVSGAAVDFGHGVVLDPTTNNLGTVAITRTAGLLTAATAATPDGSFGQNLGSTLQGVDRIWTVAPTTQPSTPVQLTLSWLPDNDHGIADFTQARMWQQSAAGQPWVPVGTPANASARSLTSNPTALSRFTVSNVANPLPVTLSEFSAQAEGPAAVRLAWTTATELNNAGFTVERSLDALRFTSIGTVAGAGTSATQHRYSLLDSQLPNGATLLYYRLRQTDFSGNFTYSPVRSVARSAQAAGFVVYPTQVPAAQAATYLYTGPAEPATLLVLDLLGRVVRTVQVDGRAQGEVPVAGLAAGAYLLRYTTVTANYGSRCVVE